MELLYSGGVLEGFWNRDREKAEGGVDEENVSLVGKSKDKKKDMSKVKCVACHKTCHYASQCLKSILSLDLSVVSQEGEVPQGENIF
jgi:hypothetical protein